MSPFVSSTTSAAALLVTITADSLAFKQQTTLLLPGNLKPQPARYQELRKFYLGKFTSTYAHTIWTSRRLTLDG